MSKGLIHPSLLPSRSNWASQFPKTPASAVPIDPAAKPINAPITVQVNVEETHLLRLLKAIAAYRRAKEGRQDVPVKPELWANVCDAMDTIAIEAITAVCK